MIVQAHGVYLHGMVIVVSVLTSVVTVIAIAIVKAAIAI